MTEFEFIDYDPRRGRRQDDPVLYDFAEALRANPGQWAKYPHTRTGAHNLASRINHQKGPLAFNDTNFQATTRDNQIYVRYVKDGEQ